MDSSWIHPDIPCDTDADIATAESCKCVLKSVWTIPTPYYDANITSDPWLGKFVYKAHYPFSDTFGLFVFNGNSWINYLSSSYTVMKITSIAQLPSNGTLFISGIFYNGKYVFLSFKDSFTFYCM
jgi:hypothetical protein